MLDRIKENLLRYTLLADGVVSVLAGAAFMAFAGLVAEWIGPAFTDAVIAGLGAFLFLWGLFHLALGMRPAAPAAGVRIAIVGDALWILGSIVVLVADWTALTALGATVIAVLAVVVADIMLLKMKGLGNQSRVAMA
jgi:hypothetical protein